ncbi:MAG: chain-length determining protein [Muribaculaceae bacterium]|nr:chain-length determining protein [Muribaculaceae bacterium]
MSQEKLKGPDIQPEEQEIDLIELATKLWRSRKTIFKWAGWGAVIGVIVAFSIPREYTATVTLAPESGSGGGSGSGLSMLASMAGVNLGQNNASDAVYPGLYPDIVSSVPFSAGLLSVELPMNESDKQQATVEKILEDHTSSPWWSVITGAPGMIIGGIKGLFSEKAEPADSVLDPGRLTAKQTQLVEALRGRVGVSVDSKTDVVTLSATLQDAVAATALVDTVTLRLQEYIKAYRTEKARADLAYARKINEEAKEDYYKAQRRYAEAADRNQGLSNRSAAIELERMQNESSLAFNLYNSTAQQVKLAEAKVQESTPVFAVVQPSTVPVKPSKPRKAMILIGFVFLSVVAAGAYVLFVPGLIASFKSGKEKTEEEMES